jgi:predicted homoserine dehydrogenase-like protein
VRKDAAAGALLTRDALEPPANSMLWKLRAEQDARFFA